MLYELIILFITMLIAWEYYSNQRRINVLVSQGFPGPRSLPFLGDIWLLIKETPKTVFDMQQRLIEIYGKTFRLRILNELVILTADVKLLEAIYNSQQAITKNKLYDLLNCWLGNGLLLSTGKKWFTRRRIITPTFHFKILEQFVEVFDQQSSNMAKSLESRADGITAFDMLPVACLTTLDIIAETAMGVKINAQKNPDIEYVKSVTAVSSLTAERFMSAFQSLDFIFRLTAPFTYRKLMSNIKLMHDFTDSVIIERRALLAKTLSSGTDHTDDSAQCNKVNETSELGTKKRMALLDVLLQATDNEGKALSNADIREEVDTFMFEGHDTTTSGISFTLYLIARHPQVQERLYDEIRQVLGDDKEKPITMRDLGDLKYLECVIKETLRLYPPVPFVGRYVTEDVVLDGKLIPARTNIILLTFNAMRDPDYFPDPLQFKPERFISESKTKIDAFTHTPFAAGPRNCIGQKFAMLEMKSTISKILRYFELLPLGPEVKPLLNIVLRSSTGIHLGIKPRLPYVKQ